jgi:mRNA deadenylase 3'-5' endonuclease subunit Ccr4
MNVKKKRAINLIQTFNSNMDTLLPRHFIKSESLEGTVLPRHFIKSESLEGTLLPRHFIKSESLEGTLLPRHFIKSESLEGTFRVMQWNVLADAYCDATNKGFPYVNTDALSSSHRAKLQLAEINRCDPDILALEEVDQPQRFTEDLQERGYEVLYRRISDSPLGILVAWRTTVFEYVKHVNLEYTVGTQVAICLHLIHKPSQHQLQFAATHLKAKHENEEIRVTQMQELIQAISPFTKPVIILGDFNTEKDSKVYKSALDASLHSAYRTEDAEPFSTYKLRPIDGKPVEFRRTIDYIFHSKDLNVRSLLEIPSDIPHPGLPSINYPSDHLALCCDLQFST